MDCKQHPSLEVTAAKLANLSQNLFEETELEVVIVREERLSEILCSQLLSGQVKWSE